MGHSIINYVFLKISKDFLKTLLLLFIINLPIVVIIYLYVSKYSLK